MKIRFFSPADNEPDGKPAPMLIRKNQYRAWSESERQFVRGHWESMTTNEIALALNRPKAGVQTYAWRVLQLKKSPEAKFMAATKGQRSREDAYSEADRQYLRDNWQRLTIQQMADVLGRTYGSVKSQGQKKMGLKKTHETLSAISKRSNAGQFQKGNLPQTTIYSDEPVIRPRTHSKSKLTYLYIRISYGKWQQYHQWMWIRDNGPIPEGYIVTFRNGDQIDVRPDNLELITMAENAIRNSASLNLTDGYVAHTLAWRNPELQEEMLKHPELIELKRAQLQLNRTIKNEIAGN